MFLTLLSFKRFVWIIFNSEKSVFLKTISNELSVLDTIDISNPVQDKTINWAYKLNAINKKINYFLIDVSLCVYLKVHYVPELYTCTYHYHYQEKEADTAIWMFPLSMCPDAQPFAILAPNRTMNVPMKM